MDKRVITAIILSMAVLLFYPYFLKKFYPQAVQAPQKETAVKEAPSAPEGPGMALTPAAPAAAPVKEEYTTVDTPLYKAVFTNLGGGLKSFELKKYKDGISDERTVIVTEKVGIMNSFRTQLDVNGVKENILFSPSKASISIGDADKAELIYTGESSNGIKVEKKIIFSGASYFINTDLRALNTQSSPVSVKAETVLAANAAGKDATGYHQGPIIKTKDKLIRQDADEAQLTGADKLKWVGLEDKYFLSALIPLTDTQVTWITEVPGASSSRATLQVPLNLGPNETRKFSYNSFIGPKEYDFLVKQKIGIEEAIEFGWFAFLAKPFLVVLNFFERFMGNYGIAIIVLTVIIKVLFYPLTKKSLNSMRDMQKMQPQLAAIKEKYKDNTEKMNKELMELYKRHKINPVGGCLPMVLQIPVFIALYEVLYVAIELRHAPFYLWIQDLSAKDPYYITPVLMGATMFLQQKMTPTSMDPAQAKIMLFMPIIFTFMFLNFPSGLVIYWLVNNILQIGQQYFIYKAPAKA